MSIVAFKLTADYAHFSHPATIYSSLTYPVPPKTAIMGFLAALIGQKEYFKLRKIKYSVKINQQFSKKTLIFNGIKKALSSNMQIEKGYQNSSEKKQFYKELICKPSYTIFVDLIDLEDSEKNAIKCHLKEHKSCFTPYLGVNFCIADFEWIDINNIKKCEDKECEVDTFVLQKDFIFKQEIQAKLTAAKMACDCEEGRIFKDFQDFVIELCGNSKLSAKNNGQIYEINNQFVYFV